MTLHKVVVIYDVTDNKRRRTINKILSSYGVRIQRSAFECQINDYDMDDMIGKISKKITSEDTLRVYRFTERVCEIVFGECSSAPTDSFCVV